jgi:hypothetical protein
LVFIPIPLRVFPPLRTAIFPGLLIFNHPCVVNQIPIPSDGARPL